MAAGTRNVLVIDDDDDLLQLLGRALTDAGYAVRLSSGGRDGIDEAAASPPDVIVLDLAMPDVDGWRVLEAVRALGRLPAVVVLSAYGRESDVIRALGMGADDYVVKPFSTPALLARIGSAAARSAALGGTAHPSTLDFEGLIINVEQRTATCDGRPIDLTRAEFDLLVTMVSAPARVHSRQQLGTRVWGLDWSGDEHAIDMHVSRLRGKLGDDAKSPRFIKTVRGLGYRMATAA